MMNNQNKQVQIMMIKAPKMYGEIETKDYHKNNQINDLNIKL